MNKDFLIKKKYFIAIAVVLSAIVFTAGCLQLKHMKETAAEQENAAALLDDEVSIDIRDYLAAYVVSDGFISTISSDQDLQEQLLAKMESGTAKLSQEQIQEITDIASSRYQTLSGINIDELNEDQINALETDIYQSIKELMPDNDQEDIEIVANGVSAIIEQNMIRQLEAMDASIEGLQQEIALIKSNILGSENLRQLNDALSGMTSDMDAINTSIAGMKKSLETEDQKLNQNIKDISTDLDSLHNYCEETATVLIKFRAYMDNIGNSSVTTLSQDMTEMQDTLETAEASVEKLGNKILTFENNIKEIEKETNTDTSGLQKELESLKNNVSSASSSLSGFKTELESNKSKTDELISNLKAEDVALLNKIETLNKTFTNLQAQAQNSINKLTTQLSAANKNISSLQSTTADALTDIEAIKAAIEALQREKLAVIDVVNLLTVNDSSKALSAAMGYQLELEIEALRKAIDTMEIVINNITNGEVDGSLQSQINELRLQVENCFTYVSSGKEALASALADKGINIDAKAEFNEFANGIRLIGTNGTASQEQILQGYTAYVNNQYITGSMPNNGAILESGLAAGGSYTIPAGFTTGGTVTAATLSSQTSGTATAANLSAGVTAWVDGVKITGTGADNTSYYNQGAANASVKPFDAAITINMVNDDMHGGVGEMYTAIMYLSYDGTALKMTGIHQTLDASTTRAYIIGGSGYDRPGRNSYISSFNFR